MRPARQAGAAVVRLIIFNDKSRYQDKKCQVLTTALFICGKDYFTPYSSRTNCSSTARLRLTFSVSMQ